MNNNGAARASVRPISLVNLIFTIIDHAFRMRKVASHVALAALAMVSFAGVSLWPAPAAAASKVRVSDLVDVNFGQLALNGTDVRSTQNICVYSGSQTGAYSVSASTGSGPQFALQSVFGTLPFEVQWADSPNSASGRQLRAGTAEAGFSSSANNHFCNNTPATASLIVVLRAFEVERATAGDYSGQLTILIAPM